MFLGDFEGRFLTEFEEYGGILRKLFCGRNNNWETLWWAVQESYAKGVHQSMDMIKILRIFLGKLGLIDTMIITFVTY